MVDQHDGTAQLDGTAQHADIAQHYDLITVGAGSGNMLVSDDLAHWRIAVVEADRFGGTCLNRGCIPSKMLVHTADVAQTVRRAGRFGIGAAWVDADWPAIRDRVFGRIDQHRSPFSVVPAAVFADPQVASVGATEQELRDAGRPYVVATRHYRDTAYGCALEDTTGFVKVLADPETRLLLGAHILGPQASTLIQPLVQAMCLDNTVDDLATAVLYIHPALSEAVEQALLAL